MSSKLAGLLVVAFAWAVSASLVRAEDRKAESVAPKQQWMQLATFMSGEHRDAGAIARVPATGGRLLLKRPLPPVLPARSAEAAKGLTAIDDAGLRGTADRVRKLVGDYQAYVTFVDEWLKVNGARRMDEKLMGELVKKTDVEVLQDFFDARKEQDAVQEIKKGIKNFAEDVLGPTYLAGKAQQRLAEKAARVEAALQELWERKLLDKMEAHAGPAFDKPVLEVARTQLAEEFERGSAVVWRGLCVTNVGSRALTNVTLDLTLTAGADEKLRRTWFFPAMKPRQTFVLYVNDRAFGSGGHTAQADSLLAEMRVLCDEGRQEVRTYKLLKDGRGHLGKGTAKLMSAEAMKAEARACYALKSLPVRTIGV